MDNKITGIYKIENISNNKIYVGQSSDIKSRWTHHKSDLNNNRHHNNHLQSAWNKYGENNFKFSIIELCDEVKLDERERFWIKEYDSYNSGYNQDCGGIGIRGYKHTEEEINKMHRIQSPKVVLQFDLNFNLLNEWIGGASHINKKLGYTRECIALRCEHTILNKMTPYKNCYWVYKEEYEKQDFTWDKYFKNVRHYGDNIYICQYDLQFNLIKEWKDRKDLLKNNYDIKSIVEICNHVGTRKTYKNCIWTYKGYDFSDGYFGNGNCYRKNTHQIRKVNMKKEKHGSVLKTFESITDACIYLNRPKKFRSNICQSISKEQRSAGYYWEYA